MASEASRERDARFERIQTKFKKVYLSEPGNPYRASGRGCGADRWEESRRLIADAVHRSGDFMDIGCANGLLLESLIGWCGQEGHVIRPYGIDFIPELIALARQRLPDAPPDALEVANAWYWKPQGRYDFVRANLEYMLPEDRVPFFEHLLANAVAPGGRLIACYYFPSKDEDVRDPPDPVVLLEALGLHVVGRGSAPGTRLAWADRTD